MTAPSAIRQLSEPVTREEFLALVLSGGTLIAAGRMMGLTDEEMGAALLEARFNKRDRLWLAELASRPAALVPHELGKVWCGQCERLVGTGEAASCWSRFCKAREEDCR